MGFHVLLGECHKYAWGCPFREGHGAGRETESLSLKPKF